MKTVILFLVIIAIHWSNNTYGQGKWNLRRCIEYARTNNISVKQQDVQAKLAALQYTQSKEALYPTSSLNGNGAYSAGRNQNPVTYGLITQGYLSSGFTLQAAATLFNWGSQRNNVSGNYFQTKAAFADVDKLRDDISLNIASAYLQALLAIEQVNVSVIQVQQTKAQLDNTQKLVNAGSLP